MLDAVPALVVTVGLLLLALRLLGRLHGGAALRGTRLPLEVVQRVALGPKQGLAVVRVGGRALLLSVGDAGTQLVTELDGEEREAVLQPGSSAAPGTAPAAQLPGFRLPSLAKLWMLAALALVPAAAGAQPAPAAPRAPAVEVQDHAPAVTAPDLGRAPKGAQVPGPRVPLPEPPRIQFQVGEGNEGLRLSGAVGLVVFMGAMTLLPALFLLMTSFTRILIVLHFLRSAIGTQTTPPGQLLVAIAVLLTGVVMNPVLEQANQRALQPYLEGRLTQVEAYRAGIVPFREFMLANMREKDLAAFAEMTGADSAASAEELPTVTLVSAYVTGELRTAFQMGFVIYLPFIVVDLVVASVLMSMGMFMLPPVMVALPFKLLLFVLADGWSLVVRNLVASFRVA